MSIKPQSCQAGDIFKVKSLVVVIKPNSGNDEVNEKRKEPSLSQENASEAFSNMPTCFDKRKKKEQLLVVHSSFNLRILEKYMPIQPPSVACTERKEGMDLFKDPAQPPLKYERKNYRPGY